MVSLAALVGCPFWARPSHCTPSALRVALGWCDHVYPRWDGHTTDILQFPYVLGAPVSLIGSELSATMGSGPSLCPAPMPQALSRPNSRCGRIIPDGMVIPSPAVLAYRGGATPTFTLS